MGQVDQNMSRFAYATLITRSSYLPGLLVLAHSLREHGSKYPLIVLYTPLLSSSTLRVLEFEAARLGLLLWQVDLLEPRQSEQDGGLIERFVDTWTKLRVFGIYEIPFRRSLRNSDRRLFEIAQNHHEDNCCPLDLICCLDADMMICQNMDSVFLTELPGDDWIGACRDCICNIGTSSRSPSYCNPNNCPLTILARPLVAIEQTKRFTQGLIKEAPMSPELSEIENVQQIRHFNSGAFVFRPSKHLWNQILYFFDNSPLLSTFRYPDQDFLRNFFKHRWLPLPWQYNAFKTARNFHADLWRDEEVICLHYVVDKPWAKKVGGDCVAGYTRKDGFTHALWWASFERWQKDVWALGESGQEILRVVDQFTAKDDGDESEGMKMIGSGAFATPLR